MEDTFFNNEAETLRQKLQALAAHPHATKSEAQRLLKLQDFLIDIKMINRVYAVRYQAQCLFDARHDRAQDGLIPLLLSVPEE